MNEVKTRVVDGTNCSKQLKFGVERILSDEISTKKTGKNIGNIYLTRSSIIFSIFVDQFDSKRKKKKRKQNKTKIKTKSTILIEYMCFKRHTQATSDTIFDGEVPLSRKLRQMRSSSNLSLVSLRSNFHFRKLRKHQPRKHRKLYKYLSAGSASTCPQR